MIEELTSKAETVFFGIMVGDMFGDVDPEDEGIDVDASIDRYANMCRQAIIAKFAEHGETVTVDWDSQNAGGSVPYGLRTRVNGETEHNDVEFVDNIIGDVWADWKWVVYKEEEA